MASAKLTQALSDLAAAVAAYQAGQGTTDPRVAELEAQVADLTQQLATANQTIASNETDDDAAADQIEQAVTAINPPAAPAPEPSPAALPEYTYSGDPTAIDPAWTPTGTSIPDGLALYTYSGDTAGQLATGDGLGGVWHLYTPPAQ